MFDRIKARAAIRKELKAQGEGLFHRDALAKLATVVTDVFDPEDSDKQFKAKVIAGIEASGDGKWAAVALKMLEMFGLAILAILLTFAK